MSKWIKTSDRLPPEGQHVLARHTRGTWISKDPNVNCVVVWLEYGICEEQRQKMRDGVLPNPIIDGTPRSDWYRSGDVHGNNLVPYYWQTFGIDKFFGQKISHWMPIPPLLEEE